MYSYTAVQWVFFFYFYCFFGWCFESAYVSLKCRKPVNRGFMRGPFLPLYGSGAIMMLVVSMPFQDNLVLVYIAGCIGATALEYVTGVVMEALFKVRYWDYSKNSFNYKGYICLWSSLAWGALTILMTEVIHKPIEQLVLKIPTQILTVVTLLLTAVIFADFALSFKAALDLKNVLVSMEKAKTELLHIQKRLDVIIALANDDLANKREEFAENIGQRKEALSEELETRIDDLRKGIEEKLESGKKLLQLSENSSKHWEKLRSELVDLRSKYNSSVEDRKRLSKSRDFFQRNMLRSNPTMSSKRFREALEELKKSAAEKRDKDLK
ncbi:MAG: hypothetical protein ACI4R5_02240 [Acetatifactor sp.]